VGSIFSELDPSNRLPGKTCASLSGLPLILISNPFSRVPGLSLEAAPEAMGLIRGTVEGRTVLAVTGHDSRGAMYAILELTDAVTLSEDPVIAISQRPSLVEKPANRVRSITRLFTSDVEDKPWFNDREMWPQYLTMLAKRIVFLHRGHRSRRASLSPWSSSVKNRPTGKCGLIDLQLREALRSPKKDR